MVLSRIRYSVLPLSCCPCGGKRTTYHQQVIENETREGFGPSVHVLKLQNCDDDREDVHYCVKLRANSNSFARVIIHSEVSLRGCLNLSLAHTL